MKPKLITNSKLLHIQEELMKLEPIFHHPDLGTTRRDYENMTDPDFWEVGASGNAYGRELVIETLIDRYSRPFDEVWEAKEFYLQEIAPDNYLLTYILIQDGGRITRRSTLWRRSPEGWKILYHQGTLVQE